MEDQSMTTNTKDYSEEIKRWKQEDVLHLANHFHKLNNNQYERTHNFSMEKEDVSLFNSLRAKMKDLTIQLALDKNNKEKHTFFPVLQVTDAEGKIHSFKLSADAERSNPSEAEVVPEIFKNMVCKNWDEIDFHLIDDLFTARTQKANEPATTVRVEHFKICKEIRDNVIKKLPEIIGITLYSGIDMNKFSDKTQISFTPVLGFKHDKKTHDNFTFGMKSVLEFSFSEVFVEYTSPCPPTC